MKLCRDVDFTGAVDAVQRARERIENVRTSTWKMDPDAGSQLTKATRKVATVFTYVGDQLPIAKVCVYWEEGSGSVANIIPGELSELTPDQYNAIAVLRMKGVLKHRPLIFAPDIVRTEYERNVDDVQKDAEREQAKIDEASRRFAATASLFGVALAPADIAGVGVVNLLRNLADDLVRSTVFVAETPDIRARAADRQLRAVGPARRGKDCLADCMVAETLISFASGLLQERVVFLTSNTKDFSDGSNGIHGDLVSAFAKHGISWAFNWPWASKEILV